MSIACNNTYYPGRRTAIGKGFYAESQISVMRRAVKVAEPFDDAV
jgi:hypothetical protein